MNAVSQAVNSALVTIRASSLSTLFDCPARFEAVHINGMRMPRSAPAQLGTAIHASTALFDGSRLPGGDKLSIDDCAGAAVDALHHPQEDVDWEDESPGALESIALALHKKYCEQIAPLQAYVGVEVKCERLELTDVGIALTGTTDRVRRSAAGNGIGDLKSGKTAVSADGTVKTQGFAAQLAVYELLAEHAMGVPITAPAQIIGLQTGKTDKAQRVGTAIVQDARSTLIGTPDKPGLLEHAGALLKSGIFFGNSRSMLCGERFCPLWSSCRYRK